MASSGQIKGITIKIEGDTSGLAKSLSSVNSDIKKTQSALKDVEKALKLDPGNVELLAQKQQLLEKQIDQTAQKLELESKAAEDAKQALELGNISQEEYATLQAEVASTAAALSDLESAAQEGADGMADAGAEAADAGAEAEESGASFEAWGEAVVVAAEAAAAAVAAVAAAVGAAAGAMVNMTLETASTADELNTMSSVTGIAVETLQEMNYASELLDVSTDTMTGAMTKLTKNMSAAAEGSVPMMENFEALGVAVTDSAGNLRDNEDVFWDAIDALGNIENETERDAAAMKIFGRSARELNPLIEAGSDAFDELAQEAHDVGYVMSDDMVDSFQDLDDNMKRLDNGATAAKNALGTVLLPVLTQLSGEGVNLLSEFTNAVLETNGDIDQLGSVIDEMIPQALDIINEYLPMVIEIGGTIIETVAQAILDNLDVILAEAIEIVLTITEGIIEALPELLPAIIGVIEQICDFLVENLPTIAQSAIDIVVTIAESISENLDELIPAVVDCILEIAEVLTDPDNLEKIIGAALDIMIALGTGLVEAIPEVVDEVPEIIANIIEAFAELGPELMDNASEWGADMIEGLISGIESMATSLGNTISGIASEIDAVIGFSVPEKGPLHEWAYNNPGEDMMDLFIYGMNKGANELDKSLYQTSQIIYEGMSGTDYSGALAGISSQLGSLGGGTEVINVYLGTNKLGSVVVGAMNAENLRTGGTA